MSRWRESAMTSATKRESIVDEMLMSLWIDNIGHIFTHGALDNDEYLLTPSYSFGTHNVSIESILWLVF